MSTPALFSDQEVQDAGGKPAAPASSPALGGSLFSDDEIKTAASPAPQTGELTNDVGQQVIVPKDGESFTDTVNRAIAHQKSMTPQQQQTAIDAEMKTAPTKAAETMAGAAGIGLGLPAAMSAAGEAILGGPAALRAVVEMAKSHPEATRHIAKFLIGSALGNEYGHSGRSALLGGLLTTLLK